MSAVDHRITKDRKQIIAGIIATFSALTLVLSNSFATTNVSLFGSDNNAVQAELAASDYARTFDINQKTDISGIVNIETKEQPEKVNIVLSTMSGEVIEEKTVSAKDNWQYSFADLNVYDKDFEQIEYLINAESTEEYSAVTDGTEITLFDTSVRATIVWDDDNDRDALRPENISLSLRPLGSDEEYKIENIQVDRNTNQTSVDFNVDGNFDIDGWIITQDADKLTSMEYDFDFKRNSDGRSFTIIEKHKPYVVDIAVDNVWEDKNNANNTRPEEVEIELTAENAPISVTTATATSPNWAVVFPEQYRYYNGEEIVYKVVAEAEGMKSEIYDETYQQEQGSQEDVTPRYSLEEDQPEEENIAQETVDSYMYVLSDNNPDSLDNPTLLISDKGLNVGELYPVNNKYVCKKYSLTTGDKHDFDKVDFSNWVDEQDRDYLESIEKLDIDLGTTIYPTNTNKWFYNMANLTEVNLTNVDFTNCTIMTAMFQIRQNTDGSYPKCKDLIIKVDKDKWNTNNVEDMRGLFYGRTGNIKIVDYKTGEELPIDISSANDISQMFWHCEKLEKCPTLIDNYVPGTDEQRYVNGLFTDCHKLTDISGVQNLKTSNVKDMQNMFNGCKSLTDISALKSWNVSNVTNMNNLFSRCHKLSDFIPISNWNTSRVVTMNTMFGESSYNNKTDCQGSGITNLNALKNWDVSNVESFVCMFESCHNLTNADISSWNVKSLWNANNMFKNCEKLIFVKTSNTILTKGAQSSKVYYGHSTEELPSPRQCDDSKDHIILTSMCQGCDSLKELTINWTVPADTTMTDMYTNTGVNYKQPTIAPQSINTQSKQNDDTTTVQSIIKEVFGKRYVTAGYVVGVAYDDNNRVKGRKLGDKKQTFTVIHRIAQQEGQVSGHTITPTEVVKPTKQEENKAVEVPTIPVSYVEYNNTPNTNSTNAGNITKMGDRLNITSSILIMITSASIAYIVYRRRKTHR